MIHMDHQQFTRQTAEEAKLIGALREEAEKKLQVRTADREVGGSGATLSTDPDIKT